MYFQVRHAMSATWSIHSRICGSELVKARKIEALLYYGAVWTSRCLINYKFYVLTDYLAHLKHETIQSNHFKVVSLRNIGVSSLRV